MNSILIRNSIIWSGLIALLIGACLLLFIMTQSPSPIKTTTATTSGSSTPGDGKRDQARSAKNSRVPTVPAGWPNEVPIPNGEIVSSSGFALLMIVDGSYDQVALAIHDLYFSHGFTSQPQNPLRFDNPQYTISIAIENRDHSAVSNNVTVVLSSKNK